MSIACDQNEHIDLILLIVLIVFSFVVGTEFTSISVCAVLSSYLSSTMNVLFVTHEGVRQCG